MSEQFPRLMQIEFYCGEADCHDHVKEHINACVTCYTSASSFNFCRSCLTQAFNNHHDWCHASIDIV